ncbi:MAG TPA: hypothetical protein VIG06_04600 [Kofleriaceae bacterium]|jgi:hypothetical protein
MGRIMLFTAALAVSLAPGCGRDNSQPAATPKATEPVAAAPLVVEQSALIDADRISVSGRVTETGDQRVVVETAAGEPLALRVDGATQVSLGGVPARTAALKPGTQVRLLYRLDGAQLVAERLDARR